MDEWFDVHFILFVLNVYWEMRCWNKGDMDLFRGVLYLGAGGGGLN